MLSLASLLWLVVVAAVWGFSTPLIRHGSAGIEKISGSNPLTQWLSELKFLATNWKYVMPFLINQSGSALYTMALASSDLSLAVPLTNSLTFIFVTISGRLLGESDGKKTITLLSYIVIALSRMYEYMNNIFNKCIHFIASYLGMTLVILGVTLCVLGTT